MIFARLPSKSIARCRCVSRLWASILRRSDFTDLYLSRPYSSIPKLLFAFYKNREFFFFSSLQPQNMDGNSYSVLASHQMKFSICNCETFSLVHGLFIFDEWASLNESEKNVVKICNPSTGQIITSPEVMTGNSFMWNLLGYDPVDKQFKVLAIMTQEDEQSYPYECDEILVLTLGSENLSWRKVECCVPHDPPSKMVCINGVLYYTDSGDQIACFDVRLETFSFVDTTGTYGRSRYANLINYSEKLGLLQLWVGDERFVYFDGRSITVKLWVLEDQEKHKWIEHTFLFSNVPKYEVGRINFEVVGMTKQKEIVLSSFVSSYPTHQELFYLHLEKKTIVKVEIQGMDEADYDFYYTFLDHVEDVKFY